MFKKKENEINVFTVNNNINIRNELKVANEIFW